MDVCCGPGHFCRCLHPRISGVPLQQPGPGCSPLSRSPVARSQGMRPILARCEEVQQLGCQIMCLWTPGIVVYGCGINGDAEFSWPLDTISSYIQLKTKELDGHVYCSVSWH